MMARTQGLQGLCPEDSEVGFGGNSSSRTPGVGAQSNRLGSKGKSSRRTVPPHRRRADSVHSDENTGKRRDGFADEDDGEHASTLREAWFCDAKRLLPELLKEDDGAHASILREAWFCDAKLLLQALLKEDPRSQQPVRKLPSQQSRMRSFLTRDCIYQDSLKFVDTVFGGSLAALRVAVSSTRESHGLEVQADAV